MAAGGKGGGGDGDGKGGVVAVKEVADRGAARVSYYTYNGDIELALLYDSNHPFSNTDAGGVASLQSLQC